jgi:hypothetical protein
VAGYYSATHQHNAAAPLDDFCTAAYKRRLAAGLHRSSEDLRRSSVHLPLFRARKPSRMHDAAEMDRYNAAVAEDVAKHILLSGWDLAHALPKRPLLPHPIHPKFCESPSLGRRSICAAINVVCFTLRLCSTAYTSCASISNNRKAYLLASYRIAPGHISYRVAETTAALGIIRRMHAAPLPSPARRVPG